MVDDAYFDFPAAPPLPRALGSLLIFGGSFDPPHRAHVALAKQAALATDCERILLVPAGRSPHKMGITPGATTAQRLAMLDLAIRGEPMFAVSRIEVDRPPPSFTVDTLGTLREAVGKDVVIRFLIGSDQALSFTRWLDFGRILELAKPIVVLRPPHLDWDALVKAGLATAHFDESILVRAALDTVSSSGIRRMVSQGEDVTEFLDAEVLRYIAEENLYLEESK